MPPQVSLFLSRDLDAPLTVREVEAVNEWLESDLAIHIMRDNPDHNVPILGGLWGVHLERGDVRSRMEEAWRKIMGSQTSFQDRKANKDI